MPSVPNILAKIVGDALVFNSVIVDYHSIHLICLEYNIFVCNLILVFDQRAKEQI